MAKPLPPCLTPGTELFLQTLDHTRHDEDCVPSVPISPWPILSPPASQLRSHLLSKNPI